MKKIGLVLSGGGHRGVAHAGALKAFEENNISPEIISGSSAGSIVGAMYAADYSPEEILKLFKKIKLFSFSYFARRKAGWVDTSSFESFLLRYFPDNSFESLSKELYISTTDLFNGTKKVHSEGKLIPALLASAAVPGFFTPVEIDGVMHVDGGIINNFPVYPIQDRCSDIYGVYVCPIKKMDKSDFRYSYEVANRAIQLMMHGHSIKQFELCKTVIYPEELNEYGLFSSGNADKIFEIGYKAAIEQLKIENV